MPTPTICTAMLQELAEHHHTTQQQQFQERVASLLLDVSSSGTSNSMLVASGPLSLMSINTPDIEVSSDASMSGDPASPASNF